MFYNATALKLWRNEHVKTHK